MLYCSGARQILALSFGRERPLIAARRIRRPRVHNTLGQPFLYLCLKPTYCSRSKFDALWKSILSLKLIDRRTAQARDGHNLMQPQDCELCWRFRRGEFCVHSKAHAYVPLVSRRDVTNTGCHCCANDSTFVSPVMRRNSLLGSAQSRRETRPSRSITRSHRHANPHDYRIRIPARS